MESVIKVGDKVRRKAGSYQASRGNGDAWPEMNVGDTDTVREVNGNALRLAKYGQGHWDKMFEVVERKDSAQLRATIGDSRFAKKFDQGKLLMRPLFKGLSIPLKAVAAVLSYGAQKYEEDSWQSVPDGRKRYEDAFYRHMTARNEGEVYDDESGLPHIAHMLCNLMFIMWFEVKEGIIDNITKFNPPRA